LRRDYGAAGLFALALGGQMTPNQLVVSLIVITLFIPCIANVMMIVKEYGLRVAAGVAGVAIPTGPDGGLVNFVSEPVTCHIVRSYALSTRGFDLMKQSCRTMHRAQEPALRRDLLPELRPPD
jgi:hypothetical protein